MCRLPDGVFPQLMDACDDVMQNLLDAFPSEGTSVPRVSVASSYNLTPSLVRMRAAIDTLLQVSAWHGQGRGINAWCE
jgi:hypothetical protein